MRGLRGEGTSTDDAAGHELRRAERSAARRPAPRKSAFRLPGLRRTASGPARASRPGDVRSSPARTRLRHLQRRLTLAYALVMLAGAGALSWLVIDTDARSWRAAEYDEMRQRAAVTASLIYYTDDGIQLDGLYDDDATTGHPQVIVLEERADRLRRVFRSAGSVPDVAPGEVRRAARQAMVRDDTVRTEAGASSGDDRVYLLALPYYHDETGGISGAVVVAGDPERGGDEHRRLRLAVLAGSGLLVLLAAGTGHVLSGRSLRPAWQALDAQERLLADAAHELRTPVTVMRGSVDMAEADPANMRVHLPRIRRATDRMVDLVENLLTRGRLQGADALHPVPLRLDQLVEQVCEELPPSRHTVTADLEESVVRADPELVRIAVRNLLLNAMRHGRTPDDPDDRAEVGVRVRGTVVTVTDRGPGVDPEELPELLLRFRSPGGGTGIGLSLVREVAEVHGGRISVRRRPGGGAAFELALGPEPASPTRAVGTAS